MKKTPSTNRKQSSPPYILFLPQTAKLTTDLYWWQLWAPADGHTWKRWHSKF